ncbi:Rst1, partial [Thalictrum thalictroides]
GNFIHVNTVTTVLRCLSQAPRLPSLDWGAIIRRCMRYEDQVLNKIPLDCAFRKGTLREECVMFAFAHSNRVNQLLHFLDELSDVSRFRTLELNLQTSLLYHLAKFMKIFSASRLEKLFDDMADYFSSSSSSYQVYNSDIKSLLRVSFWKGLHKCLEEASTESLEYVTNIEKCMYLLFTTLPALHSDARSKTFHANSAKEWSETIECIGKAPHNWLRDLLEIPEMGIVQGGSQFHEVVKRIQARVRLVMIGSIPLTDLGKLRTSILHIKSDGIWDVLVDVVSVLQEAEGSVKRQWLMDAVEICFITNYPSTVWA